MYYEMIVDFYIQRLKTLKNLLQTIENQAKTKNIPEENIMALRLAPDMFHFARQIQVACDNAKNNTARLAGVEAPKFEDTEKTFADFYTRIDKTVEYISIITPEQFEGLDARKVTLPYASFAGTYFMGPDYIRTHAIPNYMFHESMIYALARSNGFDIGKKDFFFELPLHRES